MCKILVVFFIITVTLSNGYRIFDGPNVKSIHRIKNNSKIEVSNKVHPEYFDQTVDHFNPQNDATFKQVGSFNIFFTLPLTLNTSLYLEIL